MQTMVLNAGPPLVALGILRQIVIHKKYPCRHPALIESLEFCSDSVTLGLPALSQFEPFEQSSPPDSHLGGVSSLSSSLSVVVVANTKGGVVVVIFW